MATVTTMTAVGPVPTMVTLGSVATMGFLAAVITVVSVTTTVIVPRVIGVVVVACVHRYLSSPENPRPWVVSGRMSAIVRSSLYNRYP